LPYAQPRLEWAHDKSLLDNIDRAVGGGQRLLQ